MDNVNYKLIGQQLKRLRTARKISQLQLADALNISLQHVSNIETAHTRISLSRLVALTEYFRVPMSYFLYNNEDNSSDILQQQVAELLANCSQSTAQNLIDALFALRPLFEAAERQQEK